MAKPSKSQKPCSECGTGKKVLKRVNGRVQDVPCLRCNGTGWVNG